jgi:hypothetical protein
MYALEIKSWRYKSLSEVGKLSHGGVTIICQVTEMPSCT